MVMPLGRVSFVGFSFPIQSSGLGDVRTVQFRGLALDEPKGDFAIQSPVIVSGPTETCCGGTTRPSSSEETFFRGGCLTKQLKSIHNLI